MNDAGGPGAREGKRRAEVDWAALKVAFEDPQVPVASIEVAFGIARSELYRQARIRGWRLRSGRAGPPPPRRRLSAGDRADLIHRLFGAVERQIAEIEARLAAGGAPAGADEKDARTLAALARTLELLIGLERQQAPKAEAAEVDIDAFREDLARRIEGLRRSD